MRRRPPSDRNGLHQSGSNVPELLLLQDVPDPRTDHPEEPALRPVLLNQDNRPGASRNSRTTLISQVRINQYNQFSEPSSYLFPDYDRWLQSF